MPILNIQLGGQGKNKQGKVVELHPSIALFQRGPIIQVSVTIEENVGKGLLAQGKPLPIPKTGLALIDTGATGTCIDEQVAKELGLPAIDVGKMTSATHKDQQCSIYPVQIVIQPTNLILNAPRTMGAALAAQGLIALIGRDVLRVCTFFYNGPGGNFTLSL